MNNKKTNKITLYCFNEYCVFNKKNICLKSEISLNRVGLCEDMLLLNAKNINNLQATKNEYLNNLTNPSNKLMKNDLDWFRKQLNSKEIHPFQLMIDKMINILNKEHSKK